MSELDELTPQYERLNKLEQAIVHLLASKIDPDLDERVPASDLIQIGAQFNLSNERLVRAHDLARSVLVGALDELNADIKHYELGGTL